MGVLAAISYIFGSADTSLSGILFEKATGAVNYSRFKVTGRVDPVPFRLTRMISCALGTAGVSGPFLTSLVECLKCMRRNKWGFGSVLEFFLGEEHDRTFQVPKQYLEPFVKQNKENGEMEAVYERIMGEEDIHKHCLRLIDEATSVDNIAKMPGWWCPWS
jgi:phosphatidylinositol kinase/protein kinase (PI-3  family)